MLSILLNTTFLTIGLAVMAVVTPMAAKLGRRWLAKQLARREIIVLGLSGPLLLLLWGVHNLVLALVGFASVWSALIVLGLGIGTGLGLGLWCRRGASTRAPASASAPPSPADTAPGEA
ncbi:MAG: hypothetical protein RLY93_17335 [Sumerlaeia bacterium]